MGKSKNKYAAQASAARKERKKARMCGEKRAYATPEEAEQKGQRSYQCPHCGQWHRSGQQARLLSELRHIQRRRN